MKDFIIDFVRLFIQIATFMFILPGLALLTIYVMVIIFGWAFGLAPILGFATIVAEITLVVMLIEGYNQNKVH